MGIVLWRAMESLTTMSMAAKVHCLGPIALSGKETLVDTACLPNHPVYSKA